MAGRNGNDYPAFRDYDGAGDYYPANDRQFQDDDAGSQDSLAAATRDSDREASQGALDYAVDHSVGQETDFSNQAEVRALMGKLGDSADHDGMEKSAGFAAGNALNNNYSDLESREYASVQVR